MIQAVIFDMDGLLLDTEPLWGTSMLEVAGKNNIPITREKFRETTGLRIYEVTEHWAAYYPWEGKSAADVAEEILDHIIASARDNATVMSGVIKTLELLKQKGLKIGLASSSPSRMINELVAHFGLTHYFDVITSADVVELGKPHPAVFLHCARSLGVRPTDCMVLEDSVNGMIAAIAARMKVTVIPASHDYNDPRFLLADNKLVSMDDFNELLLR